MYSIKIEKNAEKFLKKIPKQDSEIILNKIYSLKENPFRFLKRLKGYKLWRLRIHKYRVIIDVVVSGNNLVVLKIGYRKNIY
ncbi:type II toxin-antitoxin system RelE/ParE family toxin [Candidatus Pacearchaeota archaeon]|nr:type II toxin-antitoxin system RelE/ParE family toxin [Candidatus Pacearchaeota archaeon]